MITPNQAWNDCGLTIHINFLPPGCCPRDCITKPLYAYLLSPIFAISSLHPSFWISVFYKYDQSCRSHAISSI